ncbi:MAG: 4-hydroxy-tetrahydrodipicolinate synthase [Anaeroplasmataceae bacterium]|nr:4-hydroxy-tetrahydrodipicolinate synthase [Anaeroplasmataceae bacterium]
MLKGSIVALVTPFHKDGRINYEKLKELLEYHIANQTDGVVLLGTTAEATTLSWEEQVEVVRFGLEVVNKRIPVIVGAGSNDTAQAIKKAKQFSSMGADYLLTITPYYNKTNEKGLIAHFEAIAEASTCPILLYNVPSRTGMSISLHAVSILSKHPKICGIKEASGNMSYAVGVSQYCNENFILLSGNDDIIVPMMSIGGTGVISVLANVCPKQVHTLCEFCLNENYKAASLLQKKLLPIAESLFFETNPIPVKAAMNYLGFQVGGYRLPLYEMDETMLKKMIAILDENKEMIF